VETVVINTKAWTRAAYCDNKGKCCAVGFLAKSRLKKSGKKNPSKDEIIVSALSIRETGIILDINDFYHGQERRKLLREEFKKLGIRVVFK
jgi:hypothetical protein